MTRIQTVKARQHYGSKSLDITIPAKFCKEYSISEGDVFSVELKEKGGKVEIVYKRILKQR